MGASAPSNYIEFEFATKPETPGNVKSPDNGTLLVSVGLTVGVIVALTIIICLPNPVGLIFYILSVQAQGEAEGGAQGDLVQGQAAIRIRN